MFDFSSLYPGMQNPAEKTPEDYHRMCAWCGTSQEFVRECLCLYDCGKPACVRADDMAEYQPPPLPRF